MSWVAVGVAGVGLVSTFMGSRAAKKGRSQQSALEQQKLDLAREELDWGKDKYADWQDKFDPMYNQMVAEMDQDITPNYGMIAGDTKSAFQTARESNERNLMRYGIDPRDGAMQSMNRDYGIREAASHVGNRAMAREGSRGILYNRKANAANMLVGMQGIPANMVNQGYGAGQNALGGMARSAYGYGQDKEQRWGDLGAGAGAAIGSVDWQGLSQSIRTSRGNSTDWNSVSAGTAPSGPPI